MTSFPNIAEQAREEIAKLCDGNGMTRADVRLTKSEQIVFTIPAAHFCDICADMSEQLKAGRIETGEAVTSRAHAIATAEDRCKFMAADPNVINSLGETLASMPAHGWGQSAGKIILPGSTVVLTLTESCQTCRGASKTACLDCSGSGETPCMICAGSGRSPCQACRGTGRYQQGDGSLIPCNRCQGQGGLTCHQCQGSGRAQCQNCMGTRQLDCKPCTATGYMTAVITLSYHAICTFDWDRSTIPPDVLPVLEQIGQVRLAMEDHIAVSDLVAEGALENMPRRMLYNLTAELPVDLAEFSILSKRYGAVVVGARGLIGKIDDFLDPVLKPGLSALDKISKGALSSGALLANACRLRIIRETVAYLAQGSKKSAYDKITKTYPVGVSNKYAKGLVTYGARALLKLGERPRINALVISLGLSTGIFFWLYHLKGHESLIPFAKNVPSYVLDVGALVLCLGVTAFLIRLMVTAAFNKILPIALKNKGLGGSAFGYQAYIGFLMVILIWALMIYFSPTSLEWGQLIKHIKIR